MKKIVLLLIAVALQYQIYGQTYDYLDLELCLSLASQKSPVVKQKSISAETRDLRLDNLNASWLPRVGLNAQANYNSETVNFSDFLEGVPVNLPEIPLDQYKIWADINQTLYDGGAVKANKNIERSVYNVAIQQTEVAIYEIKKKVLDLYFAILLADKNREVILVSLDELRERIEVLQTGYEHGVVLKDDLLAMQAEELKMEQTIDEVDMTRQTLLFNLSVLIDSVLPAHIKFLTPQSPDNLTETLIRPELQLFEQKKASIDANTKLITATDMPKIYAFSQIAYGRPGLNIVSDEFHDFYSVGLGMKWNFLNYGESRRKKKLLDLQKSLIDIQVESFDEQMDIQLKTEQNNIRKYKDLQVKGKEILQLRKDITRSSFSKLSNGIISSTDYLSAFNNEILARLRLENHKLLEVQAAYNYLFISGRL